MLSVDRSWRNPNMLLWHGVVRLIDHGAALIFHHAWGGLDAWTTRPYDASTHALAGVAADVDDADGSLAPRVTDDLLARVAADVPDEWLAGEPGFDGPDAVRAAYVDHLLRRLAAREAWQP